MEVAEMLSERRRDHREPEQVKITVKGMDCRGSFFEEHTETIELCRTALSFNLNTPIFAQTVLAIEINGHGFLSDKFQAQVARIDTSHKNGQFVAALIL